MGRLPFEIIPAPDAIERRLAWLDRVGEHLRMPDDRRDEVLEEIAAHLDDAIDALIEEGLTIDQAEREAMARLGSPEELGENLRRTHQTTRRLLAAVGGGVWKGLEGAVSGYIGVAVLAMPVWAALTLVGSFVDRLLEWQPSDAGQAIFTLIGPVFICAAVWLATRRGVQAFARISWRRAHRVRVPVALVGFVASLALVLVIPADQTWPSLIASLCIPIFAAAGAMSAGGRSDGSPWVAIGWPAGWPSPRRVLAVGAVTVLSAALAMSAAIWVREGLASGRETQTTPVEGSGATWDSIAPTQVAAGSDAWTLRGESEGWAGVTLSLDDVDWDAMPGLQLEAWRATQGIEGSPPALVEPAAGPYLVQSVANPWKAGSIAVRVGRPGVDHFILVLVSVDPATGARTLVGDLQDEDTMFHGTPIEWFQQP